MFRQFSVLECGVSTEYLYFGAYFCTPVSSDAQLAAAGVAAKAVQVVAAYTAAAALETLAATTAAGPDDKEDGE